MGKGSPPGAPTAGARNPAADTVPSILPIIGGATEAPGVVVVPAPAGPIAETPAVPSLLPSDEARATAHEDETTAPVTPPVQDQRLYDLAPAVSAGDWPAVARAFEPPEAVRALPPALGLLYAVAAKEAMSPLSQAEGDADPNQVAIRCMAELLAVPETSPVALVLAKRLLRANPVSWRQRKAPPIGTSLIIIALGVLVGLGVGYAVSAGVVRIQLSAALH
jgi:hypothetical protein